MSFAETVRQPASLAQAAAAIGITLLARGRPTDAIPLFERSLEVVTQSGTASLYPGIASYVAQAYSRAGQVDRAIKLAADAAQRAPRRSRHAVCRVMLALAETYLCAGQGENARRVANQALNHARERSERSTEAHTLWLLGEVGATSLPLDAEEALAHYNGALALATDLEMRPLIAHCHLGLAKLYHRTDRHQQAGEHLATATTMYREMGMTYWLEKAETEIAKLG